MTLRSIELIAPDLVAPIQRATPNQLRRMALEAARLALKEAGVVKPPFDEALKCLEDGRGVAPELRAKVQKTAESMDLVYLRLLKRAGHFQESEPRLIPAFVKARAASSVAQALLADPFEAATEALYEANAALRERTDVLRELVSGVVAGEGSSIQP